MNFFASIEKAISPSPDLELLTTTENVFFSRGDILSRTAQMANYLTELGAQPGDRITVQVEKSVDGMCLYLACLQAGLVFHPLNAAYLRNEIEFFLENAEPFAIVCDPEKLETMTRLAAPLRIRHIFTLDSGGAGSFSDARKQQSPNFPTVGRANGDLAALLYSSGTTGTPKGIMLTHENLQSNAETLVEAWGFTDKDCLFHCLPIFHVHGLFVALGCSLLTGGTMRWASTFSPQLAKTFLPECSVMMGVPTYYTRMLSDATFGKKNCSKLRLFTSGSAPLLVETFTEFETRTGHKILERYGMTETGMNCSNPLIGERKPGTVGPALPGVTARIVGNDGEPTPVGQVGNLQIRGQNVFKGYWRNPEKTEEDFHDDHWFNTGDQAQVDSDGYVSIVGRSKDMVITGGLNVYPKEVEDVINFFDGVQESAVIGLPHPDFGEAVVAVVVPENGAHLEAGNVIAETKSKLAGFKVPKYVHIISKLPRNTMGKVQKKALREGLKNLFGQ
ncbi:MAG: AMP-binding protein [Lysobacterales bacterium]